MQSCAGSACLFFLSFFCNFSFFFLSSSSQAAAAAGGAGAATGAWLEVGRGLRPPLSPKTLLSCPHRGHSLQFLQRLKFFLYFSCKTALVWSCPHHPPPSLHQDDRVLPPDPPCISLPPAPAPQHVTLHPPVHYPEPPSASHPRCIPSPPPSPSCTPRCLILHPAVPYPNPTAAAPPHPTGHYPVAAQTPSTSPQAPPMHNPARCITPSPPNTAPLHPIVRNPVSPAALPPSWWPPAANIWPRRSHQVPSPAQPPRGRIQQTPCRLIPHHHQNPTLTPPHAIKALLSCTEPKTSPVGGFGPLLV